MGSSVADSGIPFISSIEQEYQLNKDMAKATEADAMFNAGQRRKEASLLLGEQIAAFGVSGVELEGTPELIMEEDQKNAEMEAMNIIFSGKQQATQMRRQAALNKQKGYEGLALTAASFGMSSGMFKSGGGVDAAGGTTSASKSYLNGNTGGW